MINELKKRAKAIEFTSFDMCRESEDKWVLLDKPNMHGVRMWFHYKTDKGTFCSGQLAYHKVKYYSFDEAFKIACEYDQFLSTCEWF